MYSKILHETHSGVSQPWGCYSRQDLLEEDEEGARDSSSTPAAILLPLLPLLLFLHQNHFSFSSHPEVNTFNSNILFSDRLFTLSRVSARAPDTTDTVGR